MAEPRDAGAAEVFPGPRPFQPDERELFFGRAREAQDLYDLALSYQVLLLYSRSGAGKTSLVNATLIPRLAAEGYRTLRARVAGTVPAAAVAEAPGFNIHVFNALASLLRDEIGVAGAATGTLAQHFGAAAAGRPTYLVFDQFEELFTLHPDRWGDRDRFFVQLNQALKENPDLHVLISIREDFVANLDPYGDHVPGGLRFRYRLERLRADAALDAVQQPLLRAGVRFASADLARDLVRDLSVERVWLHGARRDVVGEFVEPMHLQVVCRNLLAALPPGETTITAQLVAAHARVNRALADYYNAAISRGTTAARRSISALARSMGAVTHRGGLEARLRRWIERELVTGSGTRAFAFAGEATARGIPDAAIRSLAADRVVHVEQRAGADWIELSHDRFVDPIRAANERWRAPRRAWAAGIAAVVLLTLGGLTMWALRAREAKVLEATLRAQETTISQQRQKLDATEGKLATASREALVSWGGAPVTSAPQDVDARFEAASRLDNMKVQEQCSATPVVIFTRSAPRPETAERLVRIWREYGFAVREDDRSGEAERMNVVWHSGNVRPICWRAVACTLIRAGIPVRQVTTSPQAGGPAPLILVGYSPQARQLPPLTVSQLWSIK